jgi:hypothetical protein
MLSAQAGQALAEGGLPACLPAGLPACPGSVECCSNRGRSSAAAVPRRRSLRRAAPPLLAPQKFNRWLDVQLSRGPQNSLLVYPEGTRSQRVGPYRCQRAGQRTGSECCSGQR